MMWGRIMAEGSGSMSRDQRSYISTAMSRSPRLCHTFLAAALVFAACCSPAFAAEAGQGASLPVADGYRGIWYSNQPSGDAYEYKYSGGLGTYCAKHIPMAVYAPAVQRTFFVWGGTTQDVGGSLLAMVSYYDHATERAAQPRIVLDKKTTDAHDNPVLSIDDTGHLWIFVAAHGTARPAYIYRSRSPYAIDAFERTRTTNFSYPQPWFIPGRGFLFLHTRYVSGRRLLHMMTSPDGRQWTPPQLLAAMANGHYQVSWRFGSKVGTAFNYHPTDGGLNRRTNLYYVETQDFGATWSSANGQPVALPLRDPTATEALVHDYEKEGLLVYLKDLNFDAAGRPIILHLTSHGYAAGPANDPRVWRVAHWTGTRWAIHPITQSDHNYDTGCLHVEADGSWVVVGPTQPGPQPYATGGEMALWISRDQGVSWTRARALTTASPRNHSYARRPVDAQPGFYAFWADGDSLAQSPSNLYFYDRAAGRVRKLSQFLTKTDD
jgi:hypothetical protein